jgi:hypothetical protein
MSANVRLLTYDEMKALLDEHKQEHIYQVLPHFNTQHPIFQQVNLSLSLGHHLLEYRDSSSIIGGKCVVKAVLMTAMSHMLSVTYGIYLTIVTAP